MRPNQHSLMIQSSDAGVPRGVEFRRSGENERPAELMCLNIVPESWTVYTRFHGSEFEVSTFGKDLEVKLTDWSRSKRL